MNLKKENEMEDKDMQNQLLKIVFNLEEQNKAKDELIKSQKTIISALLEVKRISQETIEMQKKLIDALGEKINNGNL